MKTEHILVIRFSAMGDVAMTVPVVYSLAVRYPQLRITVLSQAFARPFFAHMPHNVGFMEADLKSEYRGVTGLNSLYRRLMAKNFTAIADLHSVLRSRYLRMRFNFDRFRVEHIDKHRDARRRLTAQNGKRLEQIPTSFQNYADVFARLGYPVDIEFTSIFPEGRGDLSSLPEEFRTKAPGTQWIGIAPFAAHRGKIYPAEKMERVMELLAERHPGARFFLFGGGNEETATMQEWCSRNPRLENASARLGGIADELTLMSWLDVMVSMDSSNMHLASLTGTPVVSVWGATHPFAGFMGWNQDPCNAVQVDLSCRPCSVYGQKPCIRGNYPCMESITPEMIADRVDLQLMKNGK